MRQVWTEDDLFLVAERAHLWARQGQLEDAASLFAGLAAAAPGYLYAQRALIAIFLQMDRAADALKMIDGSPALLQDWESRRLRLDALLALGWRKHAEAEFASLRSGLDAPAAENYYRRLESLGS
jgi:thioredoxin-like negative regulator of GroEL